MEIKTPYYFIDESKLLNNLQRIDYLQQTAGVKALLALKCFATWSVFPLLRQYMSGTTSSSLYEARLGYEKFGGETHAYCVGYSANDITSIAPIADKVIFNSVSQLLHYRQQLSNKPLGLRINPGISYSGFILADPARRYSRLGVSDLTAIKTVLSHISGCMFHFNCENADVANLQTNLQQISDTYGGILQELQWVSLGGGIYFSQPDYPLDKLATILQDFSHRHNVQIYLEPGESTISQSCELVTSVVDIVHNEKDIVIVDASIEAHMLDLLTYQQCGKLNLPPGDKHYIIAGRSCLAGDIFGEYNLAKSLQIGDKIRWQDAAGYTMVKRNWFNGLQSPAIVVKRLNGDIELQRQFIYDDFVHSLS